VRPASTLRLTGAILLAVVVLAACDSGLTAHTAPTQTTVGAAQAPTPPARTSTGHGVTASVPAFAPSEAATVTLATATGSPSTTGSGTATIRLYDQGEICWRFKLVGVANPVSAEITSNGASGRGGFPLGTAYTPSGCVSLGDTQAEVAEITTGGPVALGEFAVVVEVKRGTAVVPSLVGAL
jgi:hypothetical protein